MVATTNNSDIMSWEVRAHRAVWATHSHSVNSWKYTHKSLCAGITHCGLWKLRAFYVELQTLECLGCFEVLSCIVCFMKYPKKCVIWWAVIAVLVGKNCYAMWGSKRLSCIELCSCFEGSISSPLLLWNDSHIIMESLSCWHVECGENFSPSLLPCRTCLKPKRSSFRSPATSCFL